MFSGKYHVDSKIQLFIIIQHIVNCFKDVDSVWHPGPHISQNNKPGTTGSTDNYVWKGVEMKRQQETTWLSGAAPSTTDNEQLLIRPVSGPVRTLKCLLLVCVRSCSWQPVPVNTGCVLKKGCLEKNMTKNRTVKVKMQSRRVQSRRKNSKKLSTLRLLKFFYFCSSRHGYEDGIWHGSTPDRVFHKSIRSTSLWQKTIGKGRPFWKEKLEGD